MCQSGSVNADKEAGPTPKGPVVNSNASLLPRGYYTHNVLSSSFFCSYHIIQAPRTGVRKPPIRNAIVGLDGHAIGCAMQDARCEMWGRRGHGTANHMILDRDAMNYFHWDSTTKCDLPMEFGAFNIPIRATCNPTNPFQSDHDLGSRAADCVRYIDI
jgi:hypothetical protein